jgi:hypothetical protein
MTSSPLREFEMDGLRLGLQRRRYGRQTFTWLLYVDKAFRWQPYGDPWPSVRIPKKQMAEALVEIKAKLEAA